MKPIQRIFEGGVGMLNACVPATMAERGFEPELKLAAICRPGPQDRPVEFAPGTQVLTPWNIPDS